MTTFPRWHSVDDVFYVEANIGLAHGGWENEPDEPSIAPNGWLYVARDRVMLSPAPTWQLDVTDLGDFHMGSVITNQFSITLNNYDGLYDNIDFEDALVCPFIKNEYGGMITRGRFYVSKGTYLGSTITLECYDAMSQLDSEVYEVTDPMTLVVTRLEDDYYDTCWNAGDTVVTAIGNLIKAYNIVDHSDDVWKVFPNADHVLTVGASDCPGSPRDKLGYILEIIGCYATIPYNNDETTFIHQLKRPGEVRDPIDFGTFDYDAYVSTWNFGGFDPWTEHAIYDFGVLYEVDEATEIENVIDTPKIAYRPLIITGVLVKYGTYDYVKVGVDGGIYYVADNPLVTTESEARAVADMLMDSVGNIEYAVFNATMLTDVRIESGDPIFLTDRNGKRYYSIITSYQMKIGEYSTLSLESDQYGNRTFSEVWRKVRG